MSKFVRNIVQVTSSFNFMEFRICTRYGRQCLRSRLGFVIFLLAAVTNELPISLSKKNTQVKVDLVSPLRFLWVCVWAVEWGGCVGGRREGGFACCSGRPPLFARGSPAFCGEVQCVQWSAADDDETTPSEKKKVSSKTQVLTTFLRRVQAPARKSRASPCAIQGRFEAKETHERPSAQEVTVSGTVQYHPAGRREKRIKRCCETR